MIPAVLVLEDADQPRESLLQLPGPDQGVIAGPIVNDDDLEGSDSE